MKSKKTKEFEKEWRKHVAACVEIHQATKEPVKYKGVKRKITARQIYSAFILWMAWRLGAIDTYYLSIENAWDGIAVYLIVGYPLVLLFMFICFTLVYHD